MLNKIHIQTYACNTFFVRFLWLVVSMAILLHRLIFFSYFYLNDHVLIIIAWSSYLTSLYIVDEQTTVFSNAAKQPEYDGNVLIIIILYYDYKNRQLKLYRGIDKILNFKKYCLQNIDTYNVDHKKCKIHKKIHCVDWLTVIQQNNCNRLIIKIESQLFREHVKVVIRKRISATLLSFTSSSYVCVIT